MLNPLKLAWQCAVQSKYRHKIIKVAGVRKTPATSSQLGDRSSRWRYPILPHPDYPLKRTLALTGHPQQRGRHGPACSPQSIPMDHQVERTIQDALWRAVLLSYILNTPSTSALIRRLQDDPRLRRICGFKSLPHRSTFSRFFSRVSLHLDLVQLANTTATNRLRGYLPGLGNKVAVDSTFVRSHSNPNRHPISDPEATWTARLALARARRNGVVIWLQAPHGRGRRIRHPSLELLHDSSRSDTLELPTLLDGGPAPTLGSGLGT